MKLRRPRSWVQWLRKLCQGFCLVLFLWLVLAARFGDGKSASPLLSLFFDLDPLVFLSTFLSTHAITKSLLFALITIVATLLLGRVFCGWVCPLGAAHALAGWFRARRKGRIVAETRSPWQRVKYITFTAFIVMAAFGVHWVGILDPMPLFYRSVTTGVLPAAQYAVEDTSTYLYRADPRVGGVRATAFSEPVYQFFRDKVFQVARQSFDNGTLISLLFILIVALNFVKPRFWCRYICPLGGMLGALARRPVMRLHNDPKTCKSCGVCAMNCPAAAQPDKQGDWLPTECFGCWNCVASCKQGSLSFRFEPPFTKAETGAIDFSRRMTLAAGIGGLAAIGGLRVAPQGRDKQPFPDTLIRPPGARKEREFVQRCLSCGVCMRACPTNGLQPASLEAGLEGLWTPRLVPKIGYCHFECNLCGQVCPTEAIQKLTVPEKKQLKIGLATFDTSRCLPHNYGRECLVCEEHCPVPKKAIYLVPRETTLRDGTKKTIKVPYVDPDLCTGCGLCEWSCVFQDRAAIRVTSANESRHPNNQPILPGAYSGAATGTSGTSGSGGDPYGG